MNIKVDTKCPYCGFINPFPETTGQDGFQRLNAIILCDCEQGGCDKYYAAFAPWSIMCTDVRKLEE